MELDFKQGCQPGHITANGKFARNSVQGNDLHEVSKSQHTDNGQRVDVEKQTGCCGKPKE
jgi:hypothetical protein